MIWLWWLAAAIALGAIETLVADLTFLMLSGGALGAVLVALLGAPLPLQALVFVIVSALLLLVVRPWVRGRLLPRSTHQRGGPHRARGSDPDRGHDLRRPRPPGRRGLERPPGHHRPGRRPHPPARGDGRTSHRYRRGRSRRRTPTPPLRTPPALPSRGGNRPSKVLQQKGDRCV